MPGLLLPPNHNHDLEALAHTAQRAGWEVGSVRSYQIPAFISENITKPVMVYGDVLFCELAADALELALLEPPLEWLPKLPEPFRKRTVTLATLAEVRNVSAPVFIKPAADKSFPATVYETTDALALVTTDLPGEMPVLVSEPVIWESEFRVFVCNGKVVTVSVYFREGKLAAQRYFFQQETSPKEINDATQFTEKVLAASVGLLPGAVVIDVGVIPGKGWAVVEANAVWASGLYGCDPVKVLESIAASVYPRDEVPQSEQRFVRAPITIEG